MQITLIGAGNLATRLGIALYEAGHDLLQVYSRTTQSAQELAEIVKAEAITLPEQIRPGADLYICALRDDALVSVLDRVNLNNSPLVHTAGSLSLDVLAPYSDKTGVLYFFQSFSKQRMVDFSAVPVYVESDDERLCQTLSELAQSLGGSPEKITSLQRLNLHLAAVYACNFVNYLYGIAYDLTVQNGLDFSVLQPLIRETASKIESGIPYEVQTGPAIRNDRSVMEKHLALLESNPEWKTLYQLLSAGIQKRNITH